jgi:proteic killer suppression protein
MILSFGDKATQDVFNGVNTREARSIPRSIWSVAFRKLDMINAAAFLRDLKAPPGNKLEALAGKLKGSHSIRINDQYRIVFRWTDGGAKSVQITDYH